jgi:HSP20 family protein
MTLIKFKPTSAREMLRDSMFPSQMMSMIDSMFNETAGKFERHVFFTPRIDVTENAKAFELHVSLPGMKKEEINIDVDGDVITISGERKLKTEDNDSKFHVVESYYGKFSRSFTLPENTAKSDITASYTDGVLLVVVPKTEVKDNKTTISIK